MTTQSSRPPYARVRAPCLPGAPLLHCPLCGAAMVDESIPDVTPCRHAVFVFLGEVGEYGYMSSEYEQRLDAHDLRSLGVDDMESELTSLGYGDELLVLEVLNGGEDGYGLASDVFAFSFGVAPE